MKRKAQNVFKRVDSSSYWIRYSIDGQQFRESAETTDYKEAGLLLAKRISEGKIPEIRKTGVHSFKELSEKYIAWTTGRQRSAKTKSYVINQLATTIGDIPLKQFNTMRTEHLQTDLIQKGYAVASINKILNILRHMFTKAVEWDLIGEDTLKSIRKVKNMKGENRRLRYLSKEECQTLINACDPHLRPIVITALNTGMRKTEILSLKWDNVDMKHGFILLDKTKNGERREIPINATVRAVFQSITRRLDIPYVFFDPFTGKHYKDIKHSFPSALKRVERLKCPSCDYQRFRVKSKDDPGYCPTCKIKLSELRGIEDFHFHDLRHTFASQLVMGGVDIMAVSKLLGHKSLKMTFRYAHLSPNHLTAAVDTLDRILSGNEITSNLARQLAHD